ncbi:MAG: hypothetical protein ACI85G_000470 [Psychroserpens sp.]|jgi:hypothetical protein
MKRRKFLSQSKMLAFFPMLPYLDVSAFSSGLSNTEELIEAAGTTGNERERYELLKQIAADSQYTTEANILVEIADRWANGLEKYWTPEDDLGSSIEEEKGYLGGFFAVRSFPQGVFDFLQAGTIDVTDQLPAGFELPEENYPDPIAETSELYPIWAMYKGRMIVWSAIELGLGELFYFSSANVLLDAAYARFPENPILQVYRGEDAPWEDSVVTSGKAPDWANRQRKLLAKLMDIIDFWITERQAPDGQFGGGWGDDVELWRRWIPILVGFDIDHVNVAMKKLADGMWNLERMQDGYTSILSDVEHSAEDSSDTLTMMQLMNQSGDWSSKVERVSELFSNNWSGINGEGHRQFKSTYFTANDISTDTDLGFQVNYHARALQPVLLNWHRDSTVDFTSITEWLDGLYAATAAEGQGKPAWIPPAALKWPSGEFGGSFDWWNPGAQSGANRGTFGFPRYMQSLFTTMAQAYVMTDDPRYKELLEEMVSIRADQLAGVYSDTTTEGTIGWAAKKVGNQLSMAIEKLAAMGKPLSVDIPSQYSGYHQWVVNDDFTALENYLYKQTQAFGYNRIMFMEEVRFTDRIDKFSKEYLSTLPGKDYETPNLNALYSMITGDPGTPFFFPLNKVRWQADPRNTAVRVKNRTDFLEIDLHNFQPTAQSIRMELVDAEEAYVEWENGHIQSIGKHLHLHVSPDSSACFKVLYEMPTPAEAADVEVTVYPNPFIDSVNYIVSWKSEYEGEGRVEILNLQGKEVYRQLIQIKSGNNTVFGRWLVGTNKTALESVYVLRVMAGKESIASKKLVRN